jgi:hypothetical protein
LRAVCLAKDVGDREAVSGCGGGLLERGIGRRDVGVPWERERECVVGSGCGYQASRSHHRKAADGVSVQVWREECDRVLGIASRGRRWARREQCCSVSWDENAWRVGERSGHPRFVVGMRS